MRTYTNGCKISKKYLAKSDRMFFKVFQGLLGKLKDKKESESHRMNVIIYGEEYFAASIESRLINTLHSHKNLNRTNTNTENKNDG